MLEFIGNNEVLTAAGCTNPSKRLRYSNTAVNNFNSNGHQAIITLI